MRARALAQDASGVYAAPQIADTDAEEQDTQARESERRQIGCTVCRRDLSGTARYLIARDSTGAEKRTRRPRRTGGAIVEGQRAVGTALRYLRQHGTTDTHPTLGLYTGTCTACEIRVTLRRETRTALLTQCPARLTGTEVRAETAEALPTQAVATGGTTNLARSTTRLAGPGVGADARKPRVAELARRTTRLAGCTTVVCVSGRGHARDRDRQHYHQHQYARLSAHRSGQAIQNRERLYRPKSKESNDTPVRWPSQQRRRKRSRSVRPGRTTSGLDDFRSPS